MQQLKKSDFTAQRKSLSPYPASLRPSLSFHPLFVFYSFLLLFTLLTLTKYQPELSLASISPENGCSCTE